MSVFNYQLKTMDRIFVRVSIFARTYLIDFTGKF